MDRNRFTGKVAFVTGAAAKRGIGHAVALRLAAEGANVAVTDKFEAPRSYFSGDENWKGLPDIAEEIRKMGREAVWSLADVTKIDAVEEAVAKTLKKFGKIDILVNSAAIPGNRGVKVVDLGLDVWTDVISTNLTGSFIVSKVVARDMIKRNSGGKILLISSFNGKMGVAGRADYTASKHGVIGLVKALALEMAPYHINVNSICPGTTITNMRDIYFLEESQRTGISIDDLRAKHFNPANTAGKIPLGRYGEVEDIADLIAFLVSEESKYMTGQSVNITGGAVMH